MYTIVLLHYPKENNIFSTSGYLSLTYGFMYPPLAHSAEHVTSLRSWEVFPVFPTLRQFPWKITCPEHRAPAKWAPTYNRLAIKLTKISWLHTRIYWMYFKTILRIHATLNFTDILERGIFKRNDEVFTTLITHIFHFCWHVYTYLLYFLIYLLDSWTSKLSACGTVIDISICGLKYLTVSSIGNVKKISFHAYCWVFTIQSHPECRVRCMGWKVKSYAELRCPRLFVC